MHDLTVIRKAHLELSAQRHAGELLRMLEVMVTAGTDGAFRDAQRLIDKVYAPVRETATSEINTGPHTYIPSGVPVGLQPQAN